MKNNLQNIIVTAKQEFLKALDLFGQDNINAVPFEGSWTGGQVAEHILKSVSGILETVNASSKPTERNPEEHVKMLGEIFLNMDIKMKSPDFIIPSDSPKDKSFLQASLAKTFDGIEEAAGEDNLTETCTTFEMPTLGLLTRIEWIQFAGFHTRRHTRQLKNIADYLKKAEIEL
ncbi:MAG: DinB family protein [Bacteroidetes bacterium]|jgi:hypothetical protein|nr:DinB family protein [Bacteroidota bacterium]